MFSLSANYKKFYIYLFFFTCLLGACPLPAKGMGQGPVSGDNKFPAYIKWPFPIGFAILTVLCLRKARDEYGKTAMSFLREDFYFKKEKYKIKDIDLAKSGLQEVKVEGQEHSVKVLKLCVGTTFITIAAEDLQMSLSDAWDLIQSICAKGYARRKGVFLGGPGYSHHKLVIYSGISGLLILLFVGSFYVAITS